MHLIFQIFLSSSAEQVHMYKIFLVYFKMKLKFEVFSLCVSPHCTKFFLCKSRYKDLLHKTDIYFDNIYVFMLMCYVHLT